MPVKAQSLHGRDCGGLRALCLEWVKGKKARQWLCECVCGNFCHKPAHFLLAGSNRYCSKACAMNPKNHNKNSIKRLWQLGLSTKQIAEELALRREYIWEVLHKMGIQVPRKSQIHIDKSYGSPDNWQKMRDKDRGGNRSEDKSEDKDKTTLLDK